MIVTSSVHDVKTIFVERPRTRDNTIWRKVIITTKDGDFTLALFPANGDVKNLELEIEDDE